MPSLSGSNHWADGREVIATTPVFASRDVLRMRTYDLMAVPLVYPGQVLSAAILAAAENTGEVRVGLLIRRYGEEDRLVDLAGPSETLGPGERAELSWILPDCASQPIAEIGLSITAAGPGVKGRVLLDRLGWEGVPDLVLRPPAGQGEFWKRAWVNSADSFTGDASGFRISRDRGEGLIMHGTRQWVDYSVSAGVKVHSGRYAGLAARVRGLRRFYAARLRRNGRFEILRVLDDDRTVMASTGFPWRPDETVPMSMVLRSGRIIASAGDTVLTAEDDQAWQLESGGVGLLVADGAMSVDRVRVCSPD